MNRSISFYAFGTPAAQPRPRMSRNGHAYNPPSANEWKKAVRNAWSDLEEEPFIGGITMRLEFNIPRPKGHWTKNGTLTKSAPILHTTKPDVDNLAKSTLDALENVGAFPGDAAVTGLMIHKRYASAMTQAGCAITIIQRDE